MKPSYLFTLLWTVSCLLLASGCKKTEVESKNQYVNKFIGTSATGCVTPVASLPFGMVQVGADTHPNSSGYYYDHENILGFSHVHKSGGGCGDFLDLLFIPLPADYPTADMQTLHRQQFYFPFSHEDESAEPGYYSVQLHDKNTTVEITASLRGGVQQYTYDSAETIPVVIDLEYGSQGACTIEWEHNVDTVFASYIEKVDDYTVRGYRLTNGWSPEQHVYFYTTFSHPITDCILFLNNERKDDVSLLEGRNVKGLFTFAGDSKPLVVKTAISPVDMEGAKKNHEVELKNESFDSLRKNAAKGWSNVLNKIDIETSDPVKKELFYTSLHNVMMYPMLYSDADNRFRGSDRQVHQTDGFNYYGAVIGFWDTFRAACPLTAVLYPDVMNDYVNTLLEHYRYYGQLPIWTLAGVETFQMLGIHSLPVITNAYLNGVRNFDTDYALEAMVTSAMKDTCGYSMGYFVGLENYKKYGYIPSDLEMESVARTLEYAFDDHAVSVFAKIKEEQEIYDYFHQRSFNYQNIIDQDTKFARGRTKDGKWAELHPFRSSHRNDEYCEGTAWQWSFFVPHDVEGLAEHLGGKDILASRLDSLFTVSSELHGEHASGDITGLIGQYAQGNEPGHHTIYMYNKVGQLHKTQYYVNKVLTTLYRNTPDGICGNEDTGQMSAWYVFSSLGFYPMNPVSGQYELAAPLFDKATIHLPNGNTFTVKANNLSNENIYSDKIYLNGKLLDRTYITLDEVLQGGELLFEMTNQPSVEL